jgi:hypothetical protein
MLKHSFDVFTNDGFSTTERDRMAGRKPGTPKTGGRKKGTPNKVTSLAKDAIAFAAEQRGGVGRLVAWARENSANERVLWGTISPTAAFTGLWRSRSAHCHQADRPMASERRVTPPYAPRRVFMPYHACTQHWACVVAHRRCGKTVACVNDTIRRAITLDHPHGRFAYVAPFLAQARRWLGDTSSATRRRSSSTRMRGSCGSS